MLRLLLLVLISTLTFSKSYSQYFQFSQYNFSSQRVNPAELGLTKYASISALYRNQRTAADYNLNSSFVSASTPLLNQSTGKPWSGIGITLMDDRSSGVFKTQEASLSYAVNVRINSTQLLSFGAKALYHSQKLDYSGFYTGSQYVPDRGFDTSLSNGESNGSLRKNYTTFSTGLFWMNKDKREATTSYAGISLFDFNQPVNSIMNDAGRLPATLVFMAGTQVYRSKKLAILPEILYTLSAGNSVANLGAKFQYDLESTPRKVTTRLDVLTKYVPGRSGIIGLQVHKENFSAGMSYDFPVFKRNYGNLGAFEIGLEIRKPVTTRTKRLQAKRKAEQAKKKAASKNIIVKKTNPDSSTNKTISDIQPVDAEPKAVEIVKTDSSSIKTSAEAGKLSQEPLIMEKITLHFGFEFNSVELDDETESFLSDLSTTLKEDPSLTMTITGHTDDIGSAKFNERLSHKRAEAIKNYLVRLGIEPSRLQAEGKGLSSPLVPNDSDENRAKNRRVEINVFYKQ